MARRDARSSRASRRSIDARARQVEFQPLTITLRERGKIVGGLSVRPVSAGCIVSALWVADDYRGQGYGIGSCRRPRRKLADAACRMSMLDTFSFQAPGFYAKLGYREFGRLTIFLPVTTGSWLTKAL